MSEVLVIRRVLPVPRERVFAAWLDPVSLARWMGTGEGAEVTALDPKVGGKFRIASPSRGCRSIPTTGPPWLRWSSRTVAATPS